MAENGKVHPGCPNAANPYHECFEECYMKMGKAKPQRVKSFSGLVGRDRANRRKNRESSHQQHKPDTVTTFPYVSTVEPDHTSEIQPEKYELDNNKTISPSMPYSREIRPEDFSFNKGEIVSSQSAPTSGHITPALANSPVHRSVLMNGNSASVVSTPSRYEHEEKHVDPRELLPSAIVNEPPQRAQHAPLRSMSSSITDNDQPYQDSDGDEVQSVMSESRVTVGKYYVKESMAPILQAILDKYGDIAENCVMESVSMRSYSLECVCVVIQDLQSASFMQLTKAKVKEMLAILKDLENSRVRVDWLRRILNELSDASDVITQHQHHKAEKVRCESGIEVLKKEMEAQLEDLAAKEQEVQEARAQVTETRDRIRRGEIECSKLGEDVAALRLKLESFQFSALLEELL